MATENKSNLGSSIYNQHIKEGMTNKQAYSATGRDLNKMNKKNQRALTRADFQKTDIYDMVVNKGIVSEWHKEPVKWDASYDNIAHYPYGFNFSKRGDEEMGEPMIDIDVVPKNGENLTERELLNCIQNLSSDKNFDVIKGAKNFEKLFVMDDYGAKTIQAEYTYEDKISCEKANAMLHVQLYNPDKIELNQYNFARILLDAQEDIKDMVFYLQRNLPDLDKKILPEKGTKEQTKTATKKAPVKKTPTKTTAKSARKKTENTIE